MTFITTLLIAASTTFFNPVPSVISYGVIFYGGDGDENGGVACERNTLIGDAQTYDDFDILQPTEVEGVWGNFLLAGFVPARAYYEVRQGVSKGNGGQLLASGVVPVDAMYTGRIHFGILEYHVRGRLSSPLLLAPGKYWVCLAPIGTGVGRSFVRFTTGRDNPPSGDPNPPPTGQPLNNGNSFFDSRFFNKNFERIEDVVGGRYDFSYGVGTISTKARTLSLADSFAVTRGILQSGAIEELWGTDDRKVVIRQRHPFNASSPNAQVVVETFAPAPARWDLWITVETSASGQPPSGIMQRVELFDFEAQAWVTIDERAATSTDRTLVLQAPGLNARWSEPVTNRFSARIGWFDRGVLNLNWTASVDYVLWDISP